jgi:hypothetical protein
MSATTTQAGDLQKLCNMVKDIDFCMLTTIDEAADLHDPCGSVRLHTRLSRPETGSARVACI